MEWIATDEEGKTFEFNFTDLEFENLPVEFIPVRYKPGPPVITPRYKPGNGITSYKKR